MSLKLLSKFTDYTSRVRVIGSRIVRNDDDDRDTITSELPKTNDFEYLGSTGPGDGGLLHQIRNLTLNSASLKRISTSGLLCDRKVCNKKGKTHLTLRSYIL